MYSYYIIAHTPLIEIASNGRCVSFTDLRITSGECLGAPNPFDTSESFCFVVPSFYLGRNAGAC